MVKRPVQVQRCLRGLRSRRAAPLARQLELHVDLIEKGTVHLLVEVGQQLRVVASHPVQPQAEEALAAAIDLRELTRQRLERLEALPILAEEIS
jgi:hypothetical protein